MTQAVLKMKKVQWTVYCAVVGCGHYRNMMVVIGGYPAKWFCFAHRKHA